MRRIRPADGRIRRVAALVATGGLAAALLPVAATAGAPPAEPEARTPTARPPAATGAHAGTEVTLITGDTVTYEIAPDGVPTARIEIVPGGETQDLTVMTEPGGVYAIPDRAEPLLTAGVLDRELFNVQYLAEHGYADTQSGALPVIVAYEEPPGPAAARGTAAGPEPTALAARADAAPATTDAVGLPSINGAALGVDKSEADGFWQELTNAAAPAAGTRAASRAATASSLAGVARVWLDRTVEVSLDESVPQVGAPAAWDTGFDGSGTTVAVLDTGYDPEHPDLAGQVIATESFLEDGGVVDGHGHGTHVAATVAGTGAAADGRYVGVAPGAELLIGKVCDDEGSCPTSAIIAGMEWAAAASADVVNLSLGGSPTDGTDAMSLALDQLSDSYGTLFVVAAGNSGPGTQTVAAPGAAASALTVAAVDKSDELAGFSSRGPLVGSHALKPDIAGPGVDIVAARSGPGSDMGGNAPPVGEHHLRASGTSMATPHVAGAAAILAQRHPEWDGARLKAALMSTAEPTGDSPYEVGAGRVDAARATGQPVSAATGSIDFGLREWPHDGGEVSRTLAYRNTGTAPVTLDLDLAVADGAGNAAPGDLLRLDADTVTVPATGSAEVTVTLTESREAIGAFAGAVRATGGGVHVTTPVAAVLQEEHFDIEVRLILPDDIHLLDSCHTSIKVWEVDRSAQQHRLALTREDSPRCSEGTIQLPAGRYLVWTGRTLHFPGGGRGQYAHGLVPELHVTGDTELTIDLDNAPEVVFDTPRPTETRSHDYGWRRIGTDGAALHLRGFGGAAEYRITPTDPVNTGSFEYYHHPVLLEPLIEMAVPGDRGMSLDPTYIHDPLPHAPEPERRGLTGSGTLPVVDAGSGSVEELAERDVAGRIALVEGSGDLALMDVARRLADVGAAAMLQFSDGPRPPTWGGEESTQHYLPRMWLRRAEGQELRQRLAQGEVEIAYTGKANYSYTYTTLNYHPDGIPESLHYNYETDDFAAVESHYHSDGPSLGRVSAGVAGPKGWFMNLGGPRFPTPVTRTDYYGPTGEGTLWERGYYYHDSFGGGEAFQKWTTLGLFQPGTHSRTYWGLPVTVPGNPGGRLDPDIRQHGGHPMLLPPLCTACREGDHLELLFQTTDGGPNRFETGVDLAAYLDQAPALQQLSLTADGQPVPVEYRLAPFYYWATAGEQLPVPSFALPDRASEIELRHNVLRPWTSKEYGQRVQTTWRFTSSPDTGEEAGFYACPDDSPGCQPQPLIFLDYDLSAVDGDNTTPAGREFQFAVVPYHQHGIDRDITEVGVEVSYDDGDTWHPAHVAHGADGAYQATVTHPAFAETTGVVSLRTTARDAQGGFIEQTVESAYGLNPDACPDGHDDPTVRFGDRDSGVANRTRDDGCTFLDEVWAEAPFRNHGQFVRTVRAVGRDWQADGLYTRREAQQIERAAARSGIGHLGQLR